ncbi:hypothetical protein LIER_07363 [Lithospermum erythrorhizon]|uniref:Uncharacterized protein n=1 Tax=Lithospermum erythrorhizon TaxID=34254 RepID=A0AAV3P8C7_LITER
MWLILEGFLVARHLTFLSVHIYLSGLGKRARSFGGSPCALGVSSSRRLLTLSLDPNAAVIRDSKTAKKRKTDCADGARKVLKKSKALVEVEGEDEEHVVELGVKDSQTLEGFRKKTAGSVILKGHLCHFHNHYNIHKDVLMRAPLADETLNLPEDGYTPGFWEFFNYGLRLRASAFVNSVLFAIGHDPGQMGPFAWATLMAF